MVIGAVAVGGVEQARRRQAVQGVVKQAAGGQLAIGRHKFTGSRCSLARLKAAANRPGSARAKWT